MYYIICIVQFMYAFRTIHHNARPTVAFFGHQLISPKPRALSLSLNLVHPSQSCPPLSILSYLVPPTKCPSTFKSLRTSPTICLYPPIWVSVLLRREKALLLNSTNQTMNQYELATALSAAATQIMARNTPPPLTWRERPVPRPPIRLEEIPTTKDMMIAMSQRAVVARAAKPKLTSVMSRDLERRTPSTMC